MSWAKSVLPLFTGTSSETFRKVPDRVQIDTTLNRQNRVQNHPFIGRHRLLNRTAVTFHLKRPEPSFLALLASGWSPVYPCHVPPAEMRRHPIGTGPFKFVEFKPNQAITVTRNPDYWKSGRPYLDGIEYTIIKDLSTRTLSFGAGKADLLYGVTTPQINDLES